METKLFLKYKENTKLLSLEHKELIPLVDDLCNELPNRNYVGNCTKEFCDKIVDEFIDREFEKIQSINFPKTRENPITDDMCKKEFMTLMTKERNYKTLSNIIKRFHVSMNMAHVHNQLSPLDGWNEIKNNKEKFRVFYRNRLRCSDWFKEKDNVLHLIKGEVPEFIYGIGLSTSRISQNVTFFKPDLTKYLITKYCDDVVNVFDPFSGYSGRMLGTLALGKNYYGRDLCEYSVNESKEIYEFIKPLLNEYYKDKNIICDLKIEDATTNKEIGYDCLLTCPPYEDIESWPGVDSEIKNCDEWIDICLDNYDCKKYIFVVDNKIEKYKDYIKEELNNTSHFGNNKEYIIVIEK